MPINYNANVIRYLYRKEYSSDTYEFREILKEAVIHEIDSDLTQVDGIVEKKLNTIWSLYKKDYEFDLANNIVPLFDIVNEYSKTIKWIGINSAKIKDTRRYLYTIRPYIYKYIDSIDDRKYEALACVICKFLGAENVKLTSAGNEGGIDFIASIKFPVKAHFLFGNKGPIRIIGQCKKYSTKDNVGHMKEFVQTLNNVHNLSYRAGEVLPSWFKASTGPIIGWHISNLGHQSGALDIAKNYGIVTSTSKDIVEIICKSRIEGNYTERIRYINNLVEELLRG
ncbi:restriction endonuclease [Cellulosilyticum sp. WCF-2]|uniref:restriction endonuclease n=1 Tax=Cellulosilyticum sp. WCF-2 TaxID=2497860 RepID=UPI000F8E560B|nr:restriction endonuclease [Cellulosilyticum sp. WCF-2]QEH69367.1 restriction endonuclease [Cellulosilyticum sp. WCF-2]